MNSRLFYHNSDTEVQIGDRVVVKKMFGRKEDGTVCYIPGISPKNTSLEYEEVKQWAIKMNSGTISAMGYFPEQKVGQPSSKIVFVERSNEQGLNSNETLN